MHLLDTLSTRQRFGGHANVVGQKGDSSEVTLSHWLEDKSLRECAAEYCNATPPPKSTIALAYSPDGKLLATTHGDHTVKITCCFTRKCVRVFAQHTRTPWVVRFHPQNSDLVASGSLDGYVRVFSIASGECLKSHHFVKQLSSLTFSPDGSELAVSAGHRVYIWRYDSSHNEAPAVILKTKRTLRGLHFHPTQPYLLTAELMGPRAQQAGSHASQDPFRPAGTSEADLTLASAIAERMLMQLQNLNSEPDLLDQVGAVTAGIESDYTRFRRWGMVAPTERESDVGPSTQTNPAPRPWPGRRAVEDSRQGGGTEGAQSEAMEFEMGGPEQERVGLSTRANPVPRPWPGRRAAEDSRQGGGAEGAQSEAIEFEMGGPEQERVAPSSKANPVPRPWPRSTSQGRRAAEDPRQGGGAQGAQNEATGFQTGETGQEREAEPQEYEQDSSFLDSRSAPRSSRDNWAVLGHQPVIRSLYARTEQALLERQPVPQVPRQEGGILDSQPLTGPVLGDCHGPLSGGPDGANILDRMHDLDMNGAVKNDEGVKECRKDEQSEGDKSAGGMAPLPGGQTSHQEPPHLENGFQSPRSAAQASSSGNRPTENNESSLTSQSGLRQETLQSHDKESSDKQPRQHRSSSRSSRTSQAMTPKEYAIDRLNRPSRCPSGSISSGSTFSQPGRSRRVSRGIITTTPVVGCAAPQLRRTRSVENLADDRSRRHAEKAARRASRRYNNMFNSQDLLSCVDDPGRFVGREEARTERARHGSEDQRNPGRSLRTPDSSNTSSQPHSSEQTSTEPPRQPSRPAYMGLIQARRPREGHEDIDDGAYVHDPPGSQYVADIVTRSYLMAAFERQQNVVQALLAKSENYDPPNPALIRVWRYEPQGPLTDTSSTVGNLDPGQPAPEGTREGDCSGPGGASGGCSPPKPLSASSLKFQVAHAALCSEMGAHFSPCGKMLVLCVAHKDGAKEGASAGRSARYAYELRLYGMEPQNFGRCIRSRLVKAPQCLTSIQFSPTSRYLIVAYGRRDLSLLQSSTEEENVRRSVYTIMELWRVEDMSLVQVLPDAVDEINTAAWSPIPGGGMAYGTKEGCVRILAHPGSYQQPTENPNQRRSTDLDDLHSEESTDIEVLSRS